MSKIKVFHITQNIINSKTNEQLIDEKQIKDGLNHRGIKKWAYIKHDKDVYTQEDLDNYLKNNKNKKPSWNIGDKKQEHYHIVGYIKSGQELTVVAEWFKIPTNQLDVPTGGKNVETMFIQNVEYLTHESERQQKKGKHLYSDDEVKANFDFRSEIEAYKKYGSVMNDRELMLYQVLNEGKTINECKREDAVLYTKIWEKLEKNRRQYLLATQKPPTTRINLYISGEGGTGKGLMSRALARQMFPNIENDEDIYFEVGGDEKVTFDGYDGQPVIIWNDCRAFELIKALGSRGNVFNVFDPHPSPIPTRQNIKYGSVKLCNKVNIVNSVDDYITFLNGLAGQYITRSGQTMKAEDIKQSFRRFPMILSLHEENYDLLINKGFLNDTNDFLNYEEHLCIKGNMQKIVSVRANNKELLDKIQMETLVLPIQKYNELINKEYVEITEEELKEMFKDYGKQEEDPFAQFREQHEEPSSKLKDTFNQTQNFIDGKTDELQF